MELAAQGYSPKAKDLRVKLDGETFKWIEK